MVGKTRRLDHISYYTLTTSSHSLCLSTLMNTHASRPVISSTSLIVLLTITPARGLVLRRLRGTISLEAAVGTAPCLLAPAPRLELHHRARGYLRGSRRK